MPNYNLLIIDDEHLTYTSFRLSYGVNYVIEYAGSYERGLDLIKRKSYDAVILDLEFRPKTYDFGLKEILPQAVRLSKKQFPVIVYSNDDRPDTLSRAIAAGATLLLPKNECDAERLHLEIQRAILKFSTPAEPVINPAEQEQFLSVSKAMEDIKTELRTLTRYPNVPVLLGGETGVGKEVAARYLHAAKNDPKLPFYVVNISALSNEMLLSELFGHVKGAFTGADKDKTGYFESAKNGTILIDEIGDISMEAQKALLSVLSNSERRVFYKVGSTVEIPLKAQLVFATHVDLQKAVKDGRMREDFYARISSRTIRIPSLYERPEEILPLIELFLPRCFAHKTHPFYGKAPKDCFTPEALKILQFYDWPMNIRQLKGLIENLVIEADMRGRGVIDVDMIPQQYKFPARTAAFARITDVASASDEAGAKSVTASWNGWPAKKIAMYVELQGIEEALRLCLGNKSEAAKRLGMNSEQNIRSRVLACNERYPELLEQFQAIKQLYKL